MDNTYLFSRRIPVVKFIYSTKNKSYNYTENVEKTYYSCNGKDLYVHNKIKTTPTNTTSYETISIPRNPGDGYRNIDPYLRQIWKTISHTTIVIYSLNKMLSNIDAAMLIKKLYISLLYPIVIHDSDIF